MKKSGIYELRLFVNGVLESALCSHQPPDMPSRIEYIGGEVFNCMFVTKSLSDEEVRDLFIEKVYSLNYEWVVNGEKNRKKGALKNRGVQRAL